MTKKPTRKKASAAPPPALVPEEPGVLWFRRKDGDWVRHLDAGGRQPKCANARMAASDTRPLTTDTARDCQLCLRAENRPAKTPGAPRAPKRTREEVDATMLATLDSKARILHGKTGRKDGWSWKTVYDWCEEHWVDVHLTPEGEPYREAYPREPAAIRIDRTAEGLGVLRLAPWKTSQRRADSDAARRAYYEKEGLPEADLKAKIKQDDIFTPEPPPNVIVIDDAALKRKGKGKGKGKMKKGKSKPQPQKKKKGRKAA